METSGMELADRLHSVAIRLLRRVRGADAESRMSASRLSALSVLVYGGPKSVGELASAEQVTAPTMSRLVTGLERAGFVRRKRDAADGRRVRVEVTESGVRVLERARRRRVELLAGVMEALSSGEREAVFRAVEILEQTVGNRRSA
jgi:DNA-binding MarR family transcriptional regulator